MQQKPMSLLEFQRKFSTEKACQEHLFRLRWPQGYKCPRCQHDQAYFHRTRQLYQCKACGYQASLTAGTIFHKTRTPITKWFWMIFLMGRQKSGISMLSLQRMLEIKTYKTIWVMGHKIRKAMADRDAYYKLAGLIEMDDTYFGSSKPGKRGRGAGGKATVWWRLKSKTIDHDLRPCGKWGVSVLLRSTAPSLSIFKKTGLCVPMVGLRMVFSILLKASTSLWLSALAEMR